LFLFLKNTQQGNKRRKGKDRNPNKRSHPKVQSAQWGARCKSWKEIGEKPRRKVKPSVGEASPIATTA
jgi:hypothetical protein